MQGVKNRKIAAGDDETLIFTTQNATLVFTSVIIKLKQGDMSHREIVSSISN